MVVFSYLILPCQEGGGRYFHLKVRQGGRRGGTVIRSRQLVSIVVVWHWLGQCEPQTRSPFSIVRRSNPPASFSESRAVPHATALGCAGLPPLTLSSRENRELVSDAAPLDKVSRGARRSSVDRRPLVWPPLAPRHASPAPKKSLRPAPPARPKTRFVAPPTRGSY